MKTILIILICICSSSLCYGQEVWTIGPMLHVNFAKAQKPRVSFAIEFAYWNLYHFYHSVDGGLEFEKNKIRIYSEAQTGIGLVGLAAGPVIEFTTNGEGTHFGFQSSVWANYFLGFDYRMRWIDHKHYNVVGVYGKLPIATVGFDDTNGSHHHWDSWD
jgi:hypothetical protein